MSVFGFRAARVDDQLLDEVADLLDDVPDESDMVCWRRGSSTRFIVASTLRTKSEMIEASYLELVPASLGRLYSDMSDNRNEWLQPTTNGDTSAMSQAVHSVRAWVTDMFDAEDGNEDEGEEAESEAKQPNQTISVPVTKTSPRDAVLSAFGLTGSERTSEGQKMGLFTFQSPTESRDSDS